MAKKTTAARKQRATRNWIAYLCESLVTSGVMPTWEAATYLTENLFGEKPNPRLLSTINAYEVTSQFLQRLYHPLIEAASRDVTLPDGAMLHVFTDISLTGKSAVLVVYMSGNTHPHQLLMLDAAKAFWDPVENASFMPWLVGTALMHSLAVTEKRGGFKMWTALLAIITFSLSLLGTFIVRSGVLSSVHAFATDPSRGIFILGFLALVIGGSLALFAWRAPRVGLGGSFETVSRESMLLANNVLLLVAAAAVLLGTIYPLVIDALGMGKLSVGPPYFVAVFVPLIAPALFLMGVGPMTRWRQADVIDLARRVRWAVAVSVASAVIAPFVLGHWTPMTGLGLLLAVWVASTAVLNLITRVREHPAPGIMKPLAMQSGSYYGMLLAHFGVSVFIVGVTVVSSFQSENDVRMEPGDTAAAGGHSFKLESVKQITGPNYSAHQARLTVSRDGRVVATLLPERRVYTVSRTAMTEVAIDRGVSRDLYVALGEPVSTTAWSVRLHHKPFVNWIWGGCVLMGLGGLLAVMDRRYRARVKAPASSTALSPASGAARHVPINQPALNREAALK